MINERQKAKIGVIIGSNRPTRISPAIAEWLCKTMTHQELEFSLIDLAAIHLPFLDEPGIPARGHYQKEHTKAWSETVRQNDGFIFVCPQYNWGYPAVLKNAIDYLYAEWAGKPVGLVTFGGHGGFQAALAMNLVIEGLHMVPMATALRLAINERMLDSEGQFKAVDQALGRYASDARLLAEAFANWFAQS
ncbi:MAG: NADPH-dependent FMN reductase [Sporolactobacillus sp.]